MDELDDLFTPYLVGCTLDIHMFQSHSSHFYSTLINIPDSFAIPIGGERSTWGCLKAVDTIGNYSKYLLA